MFILYVYIFMKFTQTIALNPSLLANTRNATSGFELEDYVKGRFM